MHKINTFQKHVLVISKEQTKMHQQNNVDLHLNIFGSLLNQRHVTVFRHRCMHTVVHCQSCSIVLTIAV